MSLIPTKEATQQREHNVWQLRVRCYSQAQIAEELGITQGAVSQILKRVCALWNMEKIVPVETDEPADHYKIILGLDYDHLFTKDGVHVPRDKIAHQIPEGE